MCPDRETHARLVRWEVVGAIVVTVAGSALHFLYDWSGQWGPIALIAAVNESVWEHLKMCVWPYLAYAGVEYPFLRHRVQHFWSGKAAGLLVMPSVVVLVFYGYTAALGDNVLAADIALFVIAVALGFAVSYGILRAHVMPRAVRTALAVCLVLESAAFSLFTFYPPDSALFRDSVSGHYGIPPVD